MTVRILLLGALVLFLMVVAACAGAAGEPTPTPAPRAPGPKGSLGSAFSADISVPSPTGQVDRLIVRTINVSLRVGDVPGALNFIASLVEDLGGFVVSSYLGGEEKDQSGQASIRVPAERTDEALSRIRGMAVRVVREQTSAQDVTEEYVDSEARLRNLEKTEEQYLRLMERAENVEDTLKVQRELSNTQGQIEQLKGRMQYLERTSATSLITVDLRPASSPAPLVKPGWDPLETGKGAIRSLADFGQGLADLAIRVGIFAPVWVPLAAVGGFLLRWLVRRVRASRQG